MSAGRSLLEKNAIVLGAETRAGELSALALADAGAAVAVIAATADGAAAMKVRSLGRTLGQRSRPAPSQAIDASIGTGVQVAVKQVVKDLGGLDIFVSATDAPFARPAGRVSDAQWAQTIAANLGSVFFGLRAAVAELREGGAIIVVAHQAEPGGQGTAEYDAAKAGALALVRGSATEPGAPRMYALTAGGDGEGPPQPLGSLVVPLASGETSHPSGSVLAIEPVS